MIPLIAIWNHRVKTNFPSLLTHISSLAVRNLAFIIYNLITYLLKN